MNLKKIILKSFVFGPLILAVLALPWNSKANDNLDLPLKAKNQWQVLSFSNIPANKVEFTSEGMVIDVQKSSSPLIFPLKKPVRVKYFQISAQLISGRLDLPKNKIQGEKGADDYLLKFGLVQKGERKLNWMQRQIAADWVLHLFNLARDSSGVSKIQFFNLVSDKNLLGSSRVHPLSDLIHEKNIAHFKGNEIEFKYQLPESSETLAFWLSLDGDDSQSSFKILIKEIKYGVE